MQQKKHSVPSPAESATRQIGERIKEARESLGMDQATFGQTIGIKSRNTVSRWERGLNCPPADVLATLHDKFHISVEWIVTGKGDMTRTASHECEKAVEEVTDLLQGVVAIVEEGLEQISRLLNGFALRR